MMTTIHFGSYVSVNPLNVQLGNQLKKTSKRNTSKKGNDNFAFNDLIKQYRATMK